MEVNHCHEFQLPQHPVPSDKKTEEEELQTERKENAQFMSLSIY